MKDIDSERGAQSCYLYFPHPRTLFNLANFPIEIPARLFSILINLNSQFINNDNS